MMKKDPKYMLSDSLRTYEPAIRKEFNGRVAHIKTKAVKNGFTNWPIERYHNGFREYTKSRRGLGNDESAQRVMDMYRIRHNFVKPHMGLDGKTPAEAAGIDLGLGDDKYMDLIKHSAPRPEFVRDLGDKISLLNIVNEGSSVRVIQKTWVRKPVWHEIDDILQRHGFELVKFGKSNIWIKTYPKDQDELNN